MKKAKSTPVKKLMRTEIFTVYPEQTAYDAIVLMEHEGIDQLLVVKKEDESLCGVVTAWDIVTKCNALNKLARSTHIYECMTPNPVRVVPSMSCYDAMNLMSQFHVSRLPVIESGNLIGIITAKNITRITMLSEDKQVNQK